MRNEIYFLTQDWILSQYVLGSLYVAVFVVLTCPFWLKRAPRQEEPPVLSTWREVFPYEIENVMSSYIVCRYITRANGNKRKSWILKIWFFDVYLLIILANARTWKINRNKWISKIYSNHYTSIVQEWMKIIDIMVLYCTKVASVT